MRKSLVAVNIKSTLHRALAILAFLTAGLPAGAQLQIEIESEGVRRIPIAVADFDGQQSGSNSISEVIADDLRRCGRFRSVVGAPDPSFRPFGTPDYATAIASRVEYVMTGRVEKTGNNSNKVTFQMFDAVTKRRYDAFELSVADNQMRLAAHIISNWVVGSLLNIDGSFTSKIAYILKSGPKDKATYELKLSDYDGFNPQTVVKSREPIISPEWSPDGNSIYYVSFERQRPVIFEFDLIHGDWRPLAAFPGNNSAPAISQDSRWIAAALSEEGSTKIFLLSTDGTRRIRMRDTDAINTEPDFSPDGRNIVYVGDETGSPQLYLKNRASGFEQRLTAGSRYNVSPSYSPDGKKIAYIRRDANGFNVHVLDAASSGSDGILPTIPLTGLRLTDSPSFSPDGLMILFKDDDADNRLYTVSVSGKILFPLPSTEQGEIINPTWGPSRSSWY